MITGLDRGAHRRAAPAPSWRAAINQQVGEFIGRFVPLAFNLISVLVGAFAIIVLAVFLAAQPRLYRDLLLRLVPPPSRERARRIYDEAGESLRNWVLGKAFTMLITGLFICIGLTLFHIPGALALAALSPRSSSSSPTSAPPSPPPRPSIAAFAISPTHRALRRPLLLHLPADPGRASPSRWSSAAPSTSPPPPSSLWQLMLAVGFGLLGLFVATPLLAVLVVAIRILYLEPTEQLHAWDRREGPEAPPPAPPRPGLTLAARDA